MTLTRDPVRRPGDTCRLACSDAPLVDRTVGALNRVGLGSPSPADSGGT